MLLENQVPLRALEVLLEMEGKEDPKKHLEELIRKMMNVPARLPGFNIQECRHLLHAILACKTMEGEFMFEVSKNAFVPTARQLKEVRVHFKISNSFSFKAVSFKGGILRLPKITIDETTELQFLNLVAYEIMQDLDPEVCSFLVFMDYLIDSDKDVAILRKKGIIYCKGQRDDQIAAFFNNLIKGVTPPGRRRRTRGVDIGSVLNAYYNKPQNRTLANFKHLYSKYPWAVFSGILLFLLTILQTVYTVLSYYKNSSN